VSAPVYPPVKPNRRDGSGQFTGKTDWKAFFKKTIVIVFLFSLAVHVLLLIGFGGVTLFKGRVGGVPFSAESLPSETAQTPPAPPDEEMVQEEKTADPNLMDEAPAAEESAPPLEMMTVPGGASWAPAIPKDMKTSLTGSVGGTGMGTGTGTGKGIVRTAGLKLFGVEVKAKKLGVIMDISKSMQKYLPQLTTEIFEKFPDADVIFTNGGGMVDWAEALKKFNDDVEEKRKRAKESNKDFIGPTKLEKPALARFSGSGASDWVPVRGSKINHDSYRGIKEDYPELYEKLKNRGNTWFISSYQDANGVYLAFQELIHRKVEAIYWFTDFQCPVEGQEADKVAVAIAENQIEVILHSPSGLPKPSSLKQVEPWAMRIQAKLVPNKF
jgi:hypothetical protein